MEFKSWQQDRSIKEIGKKEIIMEKVFLLENMGMFMKVNFLRISIKDSEYNSFQMDRNMKEIGKLEDKMDMGC